jgi:hypothetical protein
MRRLHISDEKKRVMRAHLEEGLLLSTGQTTEKLAWIRKARVQLLMLDPEVETARAGILWRAFSDLGNDLRSIEKEPDEFQYSYRVEERFRSAFATVGALFDCIVIAPEAIVGGGQARNPYFFDLPSLAEESLIFVLMPFKEPWSERIWANHIKPIVEELDVSPRLACKRADNLYGHDVLLDIVAAIRNAKAVIVDTTSRNPNVFYELGIAHSFGQRVVLLTQAVEDIPFDLRRFRHIVYEDNSDGYRALEKGLKGALLEMIL